MTNTIMREKGKSVVACDAEENELDFPNRNFLQESIDLEVERQAGEPRYICPDQQNQKLNPYGVWQVTVSVPDKSLLVHLPDYILSVTRMWNLIHFDVKADRFYMTFEVGFFNQQENSLQQIRNYLFDMLEWGVSSCYFLIFQTPEEIQKERLTSTDLVLNELILEKLDFYIDFKMRFPRMAAYDLFNNTYVRAEKNLAIDHEYSQLHHLLLDTPQAIMLVGVEEEQDTRTCARSTSCRLVLSFTEEWDRKSGPNLLDTPSKLIFDQFQPLIAAEIAQNLHGLIPYIPYMRGESVLLQVLLHEEIPIAVRLQIIAKLLFSGSWGSLFLTPFQEKLRSLKDWVLDIKT